MADGRTNPWLIGGLAIAGLAVLYLLYKESQATSQAATPQSPYGVGAYDSSGAVGSLVPDQISTMTPAISPIGSTVMPNLGVPEPATGGPLPAPVSDAVPAQPGLLMTPPNLAV